LYYTPIKKKSRQKSFCACYELRTLQLKTVSFFIEHFFFTAMAQYRLWGLGIFGVRAHRSFPFFIGDFLGRRQHSTRIAHPQRGFFLWLRFWGGVFFIPSMVGGKSGWNLRAAVFGGSRQYFVVFIPCPLPSDRLLAMFLVPTPRSTKFCFFTADG
jgi:hypothetical protein